MFGWTLFHLVVKENRNDTGRGCVPPVIRRIMDTSPSGLTMGMAKSQEESKSDTKRLLHGN
jgi:hypothetical protein